MLVDRPHALRDSQEAGFRIGLSKRAGSTVRESPGSHAIYVSRPAPVVALIEQAARTLATTSR